jgi:hypothetical protein
MCIQHRHLVTLCMFQLSIVLHRRHHPYCNRADVAMRLCVYMRMCSVVYVSRCECIYVSLCQGGQVVCVGKGDDTVGRPHRAQISQFDFSSSNLSMQALRVDPLIETEQAVPCRDSSLSSNSRQQHLT